MTKEEALSTSKADGLVEIQINNNVEEKILDEERALYASHNIKIFKCKFAGPADGESCLKESHDNEIVDCDFELRYPMWHARNMNIRDCRIRTVFSTLETHASHVAMYQE